MVLTVPVFVLTAVVVDLQRLCLVLSGFVFWQEVGREQRCVYVHVERLSGRRVQRDELHGRHEVFPSSDDRVKSLALSRGVGTGIAEDCFTSSIPLTVNPFTVETVSSSCLARSPPGFVTYTADFGGKCERVHFVTATDETRRSWRYGTSAQDVDGSLHQTWTGGLHES